MGPRWFLILPAICITLMSASNKQTRALEPVQCSRTRFRSTLIDPTTTTPARLPSRLNATRSMRPASTWPSYTGAFLVHHPSNFAAFAVIWVRQMFKLALFFGIGVALLHTVRNVDTHLIMCLADLILGIFTATRQEKDILQEKSLRSTALLAFKAESLIVQRSVYFALWESGFNDLHLVILCFFYAIAFSLVNAVLSRWIRPKIDFA